MKLKNYAGSYLALVVCLVFTAGCGYSSKTVLPGDIKTVYVATVRNKIPIEHVVAYEPGLEMAITNAMIRRLQKDGNLKVVTAEKADATLEAILINYEQEGVRFSRLESVQEYKIYIVLTARLVNNRTGEVLWEEPNFSADEDYFVSQVRTINRQDATVRVVERLAKNVVDRIVEDW